MSLRSQQFSKTGNGRFCPFAATEAGNLVCFLSLKPVATDPILGLMAAYKEDPNPLKVDLGVGVYKDEQGHTAVLESVKKAEKLRLDLEDRQNLYRHGR